MSSRASMNCLQLHIKQHKSEHKLAPLSLTLLLTRSVSLGTKRETMPLLRRNSRHYHLLNQQPRSHQRKCCEEHRPLNWLLKLPWKMPCLITLTPLRVWLQTCFHWGLCRC